MSAGYLSLTDADREEMLAAIGVSSVDELFEQVPPGVRLDRALDLPPALGEVDLVRHVEELASRNVHTGAELSFLGAGIYDHYVPAVADVVLSRGEFLTAYTPYQPEMSQGVLQAIFEYQTAICELTGMDVSNASGYDGTTVAADACFMARHHTGRSKVVLAETLNPQVRQVVKTYAPGFGMEVVEVAHEGGTTDPARLGAASADAAVVIFQQPNVFGCLEPAPDLAAAASDQGALAVAHVDLTSLGLLEAPGRYGPGSVSSQRIATTASGRLGEWFELGGIQGSATRDERGVWRIMGKDAEPIEAWLRSGWRVIGQSQSSITNIGGMQAVLIAYTLSRLIE